MDLEAKFKKIRAWLLDDKPEQFTASLEAISGLYSYGGFKSLHEFVHADVGRGGLGLNDSKLNALLYFNPSYEHKAVKLAKKLKLPERAKGIDALIGVGKYERKAKIDDITVDLGGGEVYSTIVDNSKNVNYGATPDNPDKVNSKLAGGNDSNYRIAKLKRDYPEVAEQLEAGDFTSVSEAERAAGIRPPKKRLKRLTIDLDDIEGSVKQLQKMIDELTSG